MHLILRLLSMWLTCHLGIPEQSTTFPPPDCKCFFVKEELEKLLQHFAEAKKLQKLTDINTLVKNIAQLKEGAPKLTAINNVLTALIDNQDETKQITAEKLNKIPEILNAVKDVSLSETVKKIGSMKTLVSDMSQTNGTLDRLRETHGMLDLLNEANGTLDKLKDSLGALNGTVKEQSIAFKTGLTAAASTSAAEITEAKAEIMKSLQLQMERLAEQESELKRGVNIAVTCLTFLLIGIIATGAFVVFVVVLAIKNMPSGRPNPEDILSFSEAPGTSGASKNKTSSSAAKTTSTGKITSSAKINDKPSTSGEPSTSVKPTNAHQMKVFSTSTKIA